MKDYNGRKAVTIYVTDEMLARINDAAQAGGHTRSKYLSNLLEAHHKFAADMEASMIDTMAYYF